MSAEDDLFRQARRRARNESHGDYGDWLTDPPIKPNDGAFFGLPGGANYYQARHLETVALSGAVVNTTVKWNDDEVVVDFVTRDDPGGDHHWFGIIDTVARRPVLWFDCGPVRTELQSVRFNRTQLGFCPTETSAEIYHPAVHIEAVE